MKTTSVRSWKKPQGLLPLCVSLSAIATQFCFAALPPAGIDSFPTFSPFCVTINGVTYRADVQDPSTTVSRSAPTTEGGEGALPMPIIGCPACSITAADADMPCFPPGLGGPAARREIHTEMLALGMCGAATDGRVVCYLAGQPAANALAGRVPGQANYRNSFGEVVSKDLTGNPALDLPASSFWAIRSVVTITPPPPGTSGVFFTKDPLLMLLDPVATLPPPLDVFYRNVAGITNEAGGGTCGALPIALYDAGPIGGPAPPDVPVGQICCGAVHEIRVQADMAKWEQLPDLTNGLDVRATSPKILADDFLCTQSGPITDIHIWGSWQSNQFDAQTRFCLSIWSDVATNATNFFSHPGSLLWSNWFYPCEYQVYLYASNATEQFYDPDLNQIMGPDSDVWYYSFYPTNRCVQTAGTIYWLSVTAQTSSTNYVFGWKSATNHWQDDAVYGHLDTNGNPLLDWRDMHFPPGHPYGTNRSIDLAFRITTPVPPPPITNPPICTETNCLPPAHQRYGGVLLKNAHQNYGANLFNHIGHDEFTDWAPPPPTNFGASQVHNFGSTVRGLFSFNNGGSFTEVALPAAVRVRTTHDHMEGLTQVLRTEIEALEITNVSPPLRIRESPVLLSSGMTTITPVTRGYAINSFFNVWTEMSTDGGATWTPSSVPGRMELREGLGPPVTTVTSLSPAPGFSYCEPPPDTNWPTVFGPILTRNFWHSDLPPTIIPPTVGQSVNYTACGTIVQADVSADGGFSYQHVLCPATVTVSMRATGNAGAARYFDIEIVGLDIAGGNLPSGMRFRESPSLASSGEHIIRQVPGGVTVSSYFDVFLEMSLDNGLTWLPAATAVHLNLGPPVSADRTFNFDTDPTLSGSGFLFAGNHSPLAWSSGLGSATNGNPSTGGYLSIADGNNYNPGQALVVVFPDINGGLPVKAFHLTADVRAGNSGNSDGRPADGFSISYCREGDPVLRNATNGVAFGAAGGDDAATTLNPNGSGDLENGTKSGVAVIFDAFAGNMLPDTGAGGQPGPDVEGIEVRVDDKTLKQLDMSSDRNGNCYWPTNSSCTAAACADPNTEQTGGWANDGGLPNSTGTLQGLCWARLDVELTADKQITVNWKGSTVIDHFQLTNYPNHRGRLVLMGRTGNNGQNMHFDNIHLVTVPANEATLDRITFGPNLNQFTAYLSDNGPSVITNISQVLLDGVNVTGSTVFAKNGTQSTVTYTQGPFFAGGTTHSVSVTWQTTLCQSSSASGQFLVPPYLAIPPTYAVRAISVDQTRRGFFITPYQTDAANPNRLYWTDEQLEGLHGTNVINFSSVANVTSNGVAWEGVLDFANSGGGGQFPINYPWSLLGIPGPTKPNEDNSSIAASAYLYFPAAGMYNLGVNSDDGFRITFFNNSKEMLGTGPAELAFDGGRAIGSGQNNASVYVSQPGYYGARLIFENGTSGSGLEVYTTSTPVSGVTNILVNDTNTPGALLAFRSSSEAPAYVSFAEPPLNDTVAPPYIDLHYRITDAATAVSPSNVSLTVNGVLRAPAVTKPGGTNVTDVLLVHPAQYWPVGTNTVTLAFKDSAGTNYTHTYAFNVGFFATLSTNLWTAPGSGSNSGYNVQVFQSPNTNLFSGWDNSITVANAALNGIYGSNIGGLGPFHEPNVVNYAQNSAGALVTAGNFSGDTTVPGLPGPGIGTMNNDAMAATAFIEFPTNGLYLLGVNSDDGFRVTYGHRTSPGISIFEVIAPSSVAGERVGIETSADIHGFGGRLPTTPIIGRCVVTDPIDASTAPLNNAAAIAGNIALTQRGPGFDIQALRCFQAGAIAVIGTLAPGDVGQLPSYRAGAIPGITIPCVSISYEDGTNLIAHASSTTASPLVVRVSDDCSLALGEFNGGRGSADTTFLVQVTRAGLYPLRLVWENAGGDANCEWFIQDLATGVKTLINAPSSPIKAWQQRVLPAGRPQFNPVTVSAGIATLSWSGEGELEYSYSIQGPWRKAANQNNPQTVRLITIGISQQYFRIRSF
jgi:hypothetical protein